MMKFWWMIAAVSFLQLERIQKGEKKTVLSSHHEYWYIWTWSAKSTLTCTHTHTHVNNTRAYIRMWSIKSLGQNVTNLKIMNESKIKKKYSNIFTFCYIISHTIETFRHHKQNSWQRKMKDREERRNDNNNNNNKTKNSSITIKMSKQRFVVQNTHVYAGGHNSKRLKSNRNYTCVICLSSI